MDVYLPQTHQIVCVKCVHLFVCQKERETEVLQEL